MLDLLAIPHISLRTGLHGDNVSSIPTLNPFSIYGWLLSNQMTLKNKNFIRYEKNDFQLNYSEIFTNYVKKILKMYNLTFFLIFGLRLINVLFRHYS